MDRTEGKKRGLWEERKGGAEVQRRQKKSDTGDAVNSEFREIF